jgi:hypothetical protein
MQRHIRVPLAVIIVATLATAVLAQGRGQRVPRYDPKNEATFSGTIEDIQQQPCLGRRAGTHVVLKTQTETVEVCVGPQAFVQQKGFAFAKGDPIEVVGSRVKLGGKDVVIARQIRKDNQTLTLRDAQGIPQWAGWRRRAD